MTCWSFCHGSLLAGGAAAVGVRLWVATTCLLRMDDSACGHRKKCMVTGPCGAWSVTSTTPSQRMGTLSTSEVYAKPALFFLEHGALSSWMVLRSLPFRMDAWVPVSRRKMMSRPAPRGAVFSGMICSQTRSLTCFWQRLRFVKVFVHMVQVLM